MLVELAIGDAYGAGFEYASAAFVQKHNTLTAYASHPRHAIAPGAYTDDTQMTIAVVEAMLSPAPWTPQLLAHHFVAAFKRGGQLTTLYPIYASTFIWAAVIAYFAFAEPIRPANIAGMVLLIAGMWLMGRR